MKRAALYARVSTYGQDPELQLRELREYYQKQGWELISESVDQISSGKVRPNLERLLEAADRKEFDVLLVWKFDRVARSSIELCTILERLKKSGVSFTSLTEQIDTDTAAGKLVFTVLSAVAEMERSLIRERVRAGLRNARAKGKTLGRPSFNISPEEAAKWVSYYQSQYHSRRGAIFMAAKHLHASHALIYNLYRESDLYKLRKKIKDMG
jgi:DNA invertase Pin-like site-specific DNA recombinase